MRRPVSVMLLGLATALAGAPSFAGILSWNTSVQPPARLSMNWSAPGASGSVNPAITNDSDLFQLDRTVASGGGTYRYLGGMSTDVLENIAYVGIANGSTLAADSPVAPAPRSAALSFRGEVDYKFQEFPLQTTDGYLMLQYSVVGHLAPGATLVADFFVGLDIVNTVYALTLRDIQTVTDAGDFSISYFAATDRFRLNSGYNYRLTLVGSLMINSPTGGGESWATLDPGAGMGFDPDGPFPWQPAAVPEPGTLALFALGGIGLVGGAWRKKRRAALAA